jgi:hypothetical protein
VAMAAAIHPSCPLQIFPDACRLRRADVNLLRIETTQEMARHVDTLTRASGSVPFFSQMIPQSWKPQFVAEMPIWHVHLQVTVQSCTI